MSFDGGCEDRAFLLSDERRVAEGKRKTLAYWLVPFFNIRVSNADAATLSGFDLSRTRQMLLSGIFSLTLT